MGSTINFKKAQKHRKRPKLPKQIKNGSHGHMTKTPNPPKLKKKTTLNILVVAITHRTINRHQTYFFVVEISPVRSEWIVVAITSMAVDNFSSIHAASVDDAGEVFHLIVMFLWDPCECGVSLTNKLFHLCCLAGLG